jgi:hypothetical protein
MSITANRSQLSLIQKTSVVRKHRPKAIASGGVPCEELLLRADAGIRLARQAMQQHKDTINKWRSARSAERFCMKGLDSPVLESPASTKLGSSGSTRE